MLLLFFLICVTFLAPNHGRKDNGKGEYTGYEIKLTDLFKEPLFSVMSGTRTDVIAFQMQMGLYFAAPKNLCRQCHGENGNESGVDNRYCQRTKEKP